MSLQLRFQLGLQWPQLPGRSPWNRFGPHASRLSPLFQVTLDRRTGDPQQLHDLLAAIALVNGSQHLFSQIRRICFHSLIPLSLPGSLSFLQSIISLNLSASHCSGSLYIDNSIDVSAHEQFEAATDPVGIRTLSWYLLNGGEIADVCYTDFGPTPYPYDGGLANQEWNGHFYIIQTIDSLSPAGCLLGTT